MKNSLKFIVAVVTIAALFFSTEVTLAQPYPQYTLEVKNSNLTDPNTLVFDLVFTHTDTLVWELSIWQFFFWVPEGLGTFPPGFGAASSFVLDTVAGNPVTDLPPVFRPRNQNAVSSSSNSVAGYELRIATNPFPSPGTGLIIPQGVPTLIGRYKMKSITPIDLSAFNSNPFIIRDSCEAVLSVSRTKIGIFDQSNQLAVEVTRCANHSAEDGGVLPVELASFTSSINRNNVTLNWSTSKEINNSGFDVERSLSGAETWIKAGNVSGSGTTDETKSYAFTERINTGKYSYRLKQIDFNGNFEYFNLSNEIEVGIPDVYKLSQNYPNPFNPSTKIDYDIPYDGNVSILLYDISGREAAKLVNEVKTAGYYTAVFNGSNLASGMYFYRINAANTNGSNFVSTKKMVLIK
ncbi:MAG: T9SS type A sorting domain-containing protein [Ignavibacteria bacterium]|nr:T9SS type A sorting domain-containing protein [Ignavibacteria bacterium]